MCTTLTHTQGACLRASSASLRHLGLALGDAGVGGDLGEVRSDLGVVGEVHAEVAAPGGDDPEVEVRDGEGVAEEEGALGNEVLLGEGELGVRARLLGRLARL